MRIATLIISIGVFALSTLQSCAVLAAGNIAEDLGSDAAAQDVAAGSVGLVASLFVLIGMAFVLMYPTASMVFYLISAGLAYLASTQGFSDMQLWFVVFLILAIMSYFGRREKRKNTVASS